MGNDSVQHIKNVYFVREGKYQTVSLSLPTKYRKTIVVITPLMKFGGQVALRLLERTLQNTRIILITVYLKDIESLRSLLPYNDRVRLIPCGCEIQSPTAIRMTVLWLASKLDKIDVVIHLIPRLSPDNETTRFKPLLCANFVSVDKFHTELMAFFGRNLKYVEVEHTILECPLIIANRVADIAES